MPSAAEGKEPVHRQGGPDVMGLAQIKTAIMSIRNLPPEERREALQLAFRELRPETFADELRVAYREGKLDAMIAKAEEARGSGRALDHL